MQNKRGVSLMVAYVLLVVIAIGLSVAAYNYLQLYVPSERPSCEEDIQISIDYVKCTTSTQGANLEITLMNRGLFNADGAFIRFAGEGRKVRTLLNSGNEVFADYPLSPGETTPAYFFPVTATNGNTYTVEIQPAVFRERILTPCTAIITQDVVCREETTDGEETPQCGNGAVDLGEDCESDEQCDSNERCTSCQCILQDTPNTPCTSGAESSATYCSDGCDNDGDGSIDCAEKTCSGQPNCIPGDITTDCDGDGTPNTIDSFHNCANNEACAGVLGTGCPPLDHEKTCNDGVDSDGNEGTDCDDPDCVGRDGCPGIGGAIPSA